MAVGRPCAVLPPGCLQASGRARRDGAGQPPQTGSRGSLPGGPRPSASSHSGHGRCRHAMGPATRHDQTPRRGGTRRSKESSNSFKREGETILMTEPESSNASEQTRRGQSFTSSFTVEQNSAEVYDAINNVRGWWTGDIEGGATALGEEFSYSYPG